MEKEQRKKQDAEKQARFQRYLAQLDGRCFAIYGTGKNAERLLPLLAGAQVTGFLDGKRTEGTFHDWPILALDDLPRLGVHDVFLAAELIPEKIIFDRIRTFCEEHAIRLFGMVVDGELAEVFGKRLRGYDDDDRPTKDEILRAVDEHDIISFDCFDTLLMRRTLEPKDVFGLMEVRARARGYHLPAFTIHRARAERYALKHGEHTLPAIYRRLQEMHGWTDAMRDEMMQLELAVERDVLVPRRDMAECLSYACEKGKRVFVISDMYLSSTMLREFLETHGIHGVEKIFVSGECGHGKQDGLFDDFRAEVKGTSYLHIGDHKLSDGLYASVAGMDAYVIRSALAMLRLSRYQRIETVTGNLNDRSLLGLMLARIANSPFALTKEGLFQITDFGTFTYSFMAPILMAFLQWMLCVCRETPCDAILFSARDGYLVKQLYDRAVARSGWKNLPPSIYFYTSRKAAIKAGIMDENDICDLEEQFGKPFLDGVFGNGNGAALTHQEILQESADARSCLYQYLSKHQISPEKTYLLYDFSCRGTTQYYLTKAGMTHLCGCYFQYFMGSSMHALPVRAYDVAEVQMPGLYTFLFESVDASPEPSLETFSPAGEPVFSEVVSWKNDWGIISEGQQHIRQFVETYMDTLYDADQPISKGLIRQIAAMWPDYLPDIHEVTEKLRVGDTMRGCLLRLEDC